MAISKNEKYSLFEKYIICKNPHRVDNYYKSGVCWINFFYENIEFLPYLLFIGLKWSIDLNSNWDSNEGSRQYVNKFFDWRNNSCEISRSNGFPIYQLFNYFEFNTPAVIKKYSIFIEKQINDNYLNLYYEILDHANWIVNKHKGHLQQNDALNSNLIECFLKWDETFLNQQINKNEVEQSLEYILNLFNFNNFFE